MMMTTTTTMTTMMTTMMMMTMMKLDNRQDATFAAQLFQWQTTKAAKKK